MMDQKPVRAWHALPADEVLGLQGSSPSGLAAQQAAERLRRLGPNRLPEPPRRGPLKRILSQFDNLLIYVLIGAAVLTALLGHVLDTLVIAGVVVVNAIIGFIQEGKAEEALQALRQLLSPQATVVRGGQRTAVSADTLVLGDVVVLEPGDKVAADLRLIRARELRIDESLLTGESMPSAKGVEPVDESAVVGDRRSMAYSGTLVTGGHGLGVVVATGADTEIGRISALLESVQTLMTPLLRRIAQFSRQLTVAILAASALIFAVGLGLKALELSELFLAVVSLAVAAIPEGLPAIMTVTLAIGVQTMAANNAIVRRLPAVETLGSVTVVCSDKTGTLTRNEMTVQRVVTGEAEYAVRGVGYAPVGDFERDGKPTDPESDPVLMELLAGAALCNDAELRHENGDWRLQGDPTEGALLTLALKADLQQDKLRGHWPRMDAIPFESEHRFMATLHHDHEGHGRVYVKGAPEVLLARCRRVMGPDGEVGAAIGQWHDRVAALAAEGQRVLALAVRDAADDATTLHHDDVSGDLTLLGLVGIMDPPREEVIDAVAECQAAGIRVKMITGDHAATALAIARRIGIHDTGALTGVEIEALDDEALRRAVAGTDVFARASPEHKLRLVQALQANGEVTAMTGDGVNDAPALRRADVGIAMGRKGTEAAKEAAEMVLADDNFASIARAVREGRTVYDNLVKAILFLLPVNGGEALALVVALLMGETLPISPLQILWVNMVSSVTLAMALAFEPAEADIMRRPPRAVDAPLFSPLLLWRIGFVSLLFVTGVYGVFHFSIAQGLSVELARTLAVNTLVVMEVFYLFSVRYKDATSLAPRAFLGTPAVLVAVAAVTVLQLTFTFAPFMQTFFQTRTLDFTQSVTVLTVGVAALAVLEIEKLVRRRMFA